MGLSVILSFVYLIASRLTYVVGVGFALTQQDRKQIFTRRYGVEGGWRRFVRFASPIMVNDGIAFVTLNVMTINTLQIDVPRAAVIVFGFVIGIIGIAVKVWATATLGSKAYYWHNFFAPSASGAPKATGPYKYFKNPMYGIGYLQTYGLALVLGSLPGLIAAAFMQAGIFAFNHFVEKPHFETLNGAAAQ
jgi:protein-S-isoprenylcysteine O-methyltransferase Ste14